jgi:hypothetical protein
MNRNLLLGLFATVTILLTSCRGYVTTPNYADLQGRWRLQSIERQGNFGWENVYSDYQQGTFYFYGGGNITYSDAYGNMNGSWYRQTISNGGSESYNRFDLSMDLYSTNSSDRINWDFQDCQFSGYYQFTGYYDTPYYSYRYRFVRD